MDVAELRWFLVLAETEHVTDAAAVLHITQPTLSRALRRLETELGVPLFDRDHHRLRLNRYGEAYREHARRALDELTAAEDRLAALRDPRRGTVSLAFPHSFGGWLIPELIGAYREREPQTRFLLHSDAADAVLAALRDGAADLAITGPEPDDPDIAWNALAEERLWLAVPRGHRLAARDSVRLAELAGETFIALRAAFGLRQITDRLLTEAGITPEIGMESTEIATIMGLVASGLGVAIVPALPQRAGPAGARLVPIAGEAVRTIGIAEYRRRPTAPAARRFAEFVTERFDQS
ncbi:LysR family transcriptional regulator [Amycolatopsis aidingensis]|uniref:LysR family transcriptional regulator n=1 Tax=Amycolatopsis aidingensis TaxID=2842453 RepID=UPI001C0D4ECD|nr:LysR family transcriptional regulator [Amycolatopsis aidingensis]